MDDAASPRDTPQLHHWLQEQWAYARRHTTRARVRFFLHQHVPILEWLPTYDIHEDLQYDLVAGLTVGLMLVPQEISLAAMMGVPAIYGLYTAALVPMIYPLFGTSRVLSVANGAEVSLLVGSAIKKLESEEERVATGILLSFLSGLILFLMGVFRLGIIADFFSRPVMGGFISAGGVLIMLSQFANWLGVEVPSRDLPFLTVCDLFEQSPHLSWASLLLGAVSIAVLQGMRILKRRVVREMNRLEEELEEEFAVETSRAMSRLQDSEDEDVTSGDHDHGHGHQAQKDQARDEIEDVQLAPAPSAANQSQSHSQDKLKQEGNNNNSSNRPVPCRLPPKAEDAALRPRTSTARSSRFALGGRGAAASSSRSSLARASPVPDWMPSALYSTGSLRRSDYLSSPYDSSTMPASARELEGRSSRHSDVTHVTRSTRSLRNSHIINDDGVGFSLSDEDYLHLEQPLEYAYSRRSMTNEDLLRRSSGMAPSLRRGISSTTSAAAMMVASSSTTATASSMTPRPHAGEPLSPTKSLSDDTVSITDSTCSTTALNGRTLDAIVSSSKPIRMLRSKIAVLIALRLVCDLGAFMVCLMGGIVGYLMGKDGDLKLSGDVPGGYPSPILPWYGLLDKLIEADRLYHIVIDTLSIAIISYMSSIAMAKRLAIKEGYRIRPNQELIALGFSNLIGSFFQGMPSTGGLSRTAVNMQNARTQLASLITVGVVVFALYTSTSMLAYLPKTSLSAIIIVAGHSLIEMKEAKWLYRVKRDEFYVWLASFVLTVLLGVLPGLLSSIFCSLIAVIYKTRRPTLTMLGEIIVDEDTRETRLVDLDLYPDTAHPLSDIVVIRVEGALYFANCEYVERVVEREIQKRERTEGVVVHGVIIDACSIMDWDSTTIQMMKHLNEDLHVRGIQLAIVNARDRLQNLLESTEFLFGIVAGDARIGFDEAIRVIREVAVTIVPTSDSPRRRGNNGRRNSRSHSTTSSTHSDSGTLETTEATRSVAAM